MKLPAEQVSQLHRAVRYITRAMEQTLHAQTMIQIILLLVVVICPVLLSIQACCSSLLVVQHSVE